MAYKRVLWLGKKVQRILDFSKKKMFARQPGFHNFRALSSFHRAANNGRSTDNVRSKLGTDRTNPWIAGHLVRSFTDSFKEILIFTCLIITSDNSHVSERKKNEYKSRQISCREIPGSRKFPRCHQVLQRPQIIVSSVILFTLFKCSQLVEGFTFGQIP